MGFWGVRSGSCVRKAEVEGRLDDRALVVRVDVVGPIWRGPLNWTWTNTVCAPRKTRGVGVDAVGGE